MTPDTDAQSKETAMSEREELVKRLDARIDAEYLQRRADSIAAELHMSMPPRELERLLIDCRKALTAQPQQEPVGDTGNPEADSVINRLMSDDPDFDDCTNAAVLIRKLVAEHRGPDGFATWKDAAIAERLKRVSQPQGEPVAWSVLDKRTGKHWYTHESPHTAQHYADEYSHREGDGSQSMVITPLYTAPPSGVREAVEAAPQSEQVNAGETSRSRLAESQARAVSDSRDGGVASITGWQPLPPLPTERKV